MVFAKRKYIVVVESFDCRLLETNKKKKQRFFCDLMQCSFFFFFVFVVVLYVMDVL